MTEKFIVVPLNQSIASVWMLRPDYTGMRNILEERGYTVKGPEIAQRPDLLAIKGTVEVFSSSERRTVGVRGLTSIRDLVDAYTELIKINFDSLGVDPENILFHEFIGNFTVSNSVNPMNVLSKVNQKVDVIRKIGSVFGIEASAIGLNIVLKGSSPTSKRWFNISIEPFFVSYSKRYHISIVYRDVLDSVTELVKHLENRLKQVVSKLEEEAQSN